MAVLAVGGGSHRLAPLQVWSLQYDFYLHGQTAASVAALLFLSRKRQVLGARVREDCSKLQRFLQAVAMLWNILQSSDRAGVEMRAGNIS